MKSLLERLDKRITITRLFREDEWRGDTAIDASTTFDADKSYDPSTPAHKFWGDVVGPSGNRDEYGQPRDDAVQVCTVWAAIEPLQGREYFAAMQEHADVTTRIRIRYREGIDRTMFVRYGDAVFEILYVLHPQFGKKELQLMCKERQ